MKKIIFLMLTGWIFSTATGAAQDGAISRLPGFQGTFVQGRAYMFTVFGDTRTSAVGSLDGHDVAFSLARNKVFEQIGSELITKNAAFSLFTGDLIWKGGEQVYWDEVAEFFPERIRENIFPIPGNHETWGDPGLANYFSFFSHLDHRHSYYFTLGNSLFVSLCSGGYVGEYSKKNAYAQDRTFNCTQADYQGLQLDVFLDRAEAQMAGAGTALKNVFVQYHKPSFSYYKHPPLETGSDPVDALKAFARSRENLQILVFNGHNHTTELYRPAANISVLVAGGGGAPQAVLSPDLPGSAVKKIYQEKGVTELFWEALGSTTENRTQRINYWTVQVDDGANTVTVTEKVLTFTGRAHVFVDGLTLVNGKVR